MSKWEQTPFNDLEKAREWANAHGHVPSDIQIDEEHQLRYFRTKHQYVLAQRLTGGPVLQRYAPNLYKYEKQRKCGPWNLSKEFRSLRDVRRHYNDDFALSEKFKIEFVLLVEWKGDEFEYVERDGRVYARVIARPND